MRAWPLHFVFATILFGSLAAKERATDILVDVNNLDLEASTKRVAQSHGLIFRDHIQVAGNAFALVFEAPNCSGPVLVVLRMSFDLETVVRPLRERGDILRYVYIDGSWENPAPLSFFAERIKYAALATFGLTRYVPSGYVLLVALPPRCPITDAIDWRVVWNRDYVGGRL
jgi:hypothetical protein